MSNSKIKVQAAAKMSEGHSYYRRAGLVLLKDQKEFEVDIDQLAILRADKRVIVVGGPETLPKRTVEKPNDEREVRMQQLAESRDQLEVRAKAAELENERLKAQLGAIEAKKKKKAEDDEENSKKE